MSFQKVFLRPAALALLFAALFMTGCGADAPTDEHLALTLETAFARQQPVEVDDVEPKWVELSETRLEGKVSFTLRLKENLYQSAELADELAALKLDSAELALLRQAREEAGKLAEPLRSTLLEKAPASIERQRFIKAAEEAGDEFPAEAVIKAQKNADGWELEIVSASQPRNLAGRPRSALSAEALVVGSPEAEKLVKESTQAAREYAKLVEQSAADAARALAEAIVKQRAALLEVIKPGAVFLGTVANADKSVSESGLVIEEVDPKTNVVKGFAFENDPRQKRPFLGTIREGDAPLLFNISTDQPNALSVAELALQDGRLVGTLAAAERRSAGDSDYRLSSKNTWGAVSWALSDPKALEAKIALAVTQEQAAQKQRDDYQAALSAALAPGQAFQGVWVYWGRRGEIGLFIETVSTNGLSCEGYLFDPANRAKRKPFTCIVNREFGAEVPLIVTTVLGEGLAYSAQLTTTQDTWLKSGTQNTIQLIPKDDGWASSTRNFTLELVPMPDFAALLAQDQAADEARQAAEKAAVEPNTIYVGTWRGSQFSGELGLRMLTLGDSGLIFTAEVFDPKDPAETWSYNGSVLQENGRALFRLIPSGKGRNTATSRQAGSTHNLLNSVTNSFNHLSLTVSAEGLSGRLDNVPVSLKKISAAPAPVTPVPVAAQAAPTPAADSAAPVTPAPVTPAPAVAPTAAAPTGAVPTGTAPTGAYPPLVLASNAKPKIAAHRVSQEGEAVRLALQVLAPGKKISAVRLDNLGGVQAHWRSDGQEGAAPLSVSLGDQRFMAGLPSLDVDTGAAEILLSLSLTDNGAFAGQATEFRLTVFFADGERAMCFLK